MADEQGTRRGSAWGWFMVALALTVWAWRLYEGNGRYINWTDRDFWRIGRLWIDLPVSGAEMNYGEGGRLPGGGYHLLAAIPLSWRSDPMDVWRFFVALDALAALALARFVAARGGVMLAGFVLLGLVTWSDVRATMTWIWNPMAMPFLVTLSIVALGDALRRDRPVSLFGWAFALALGAHNHFTSAAWLMWTTLGLLIVRPGLLRRGALPALAGLLVPYLPFLIKEVLTGWPETALIRQQRATRVGADGSSWWSRAWELAETLGLLVPCQPEGMPLDRPVLAGISALTLVAAAVGAWWAWRRSGPDRDLLRVVSVGVLLVVLTPALGDDVKVEERYLLVALPGLALLAGRGFLALASRGEVFAAIAVLIAAANPAVELGRASRPVQRNPYAHPERLVPLLDALEDLAGGGGRGEVAGRMVLLERTERGVTTLPPTPIDWWLQQEGEVFPGSLPGPCLFALREHEDSDAQVALTQAFPWLSPRLSDVQRIADDLRIGRFEVEGDRCPTIAAGRYVPHPDEEAARRVWSSLPPGQAARTDDGGAVVMFGDGVHAKVAVVLRLDTGPDGVTARWASGQLRGHAYNGGWLRDGMLGGLALVLTADDGRVERVSLYAGRVGPTLVSSPMSHAVTVPPGHWSVALAATPYGEPERASGGPDTWTRMDEQVVPTGLTVDGLASP